MVGKNIMVPSLHPSIFSACRLVSKINGVCGSDGLHAKLASSKGSELNCNGPAACELPRPSA